MFYRGQRGYSDSTISVTDSSFEFTPTECGQSSQLPIAAQNVSVNFYGFSSAWNSMNIYQHPQCTTPISDPDIHCSTLFDCHVPPEHSSAALPPPSELPPRRHIHRNRRRKVSKCRTWEIDDEVLPEPPVFDSHDRWIDGDSKCAYRVDKGRKNKCLQTGWAMRNSNNHKKNILKKSCLGIFRCSKPLCGAIVLPAISELPRRSQISCPKKNCGGRLDYQSCKGNNGHPVTHCWRRVGDILYLQVRGTHDHPKPQCKASRQRSTLQVSQDAISSETETSSQSTISSSTSFPAVTPCQHSIPPQFESRNPPRMPFTRTSNLASDISNRSNNSLYQQVMNSYSQSFYTNEFQHHTSRSSGAFPNDNSASESVVPQKSSDSPSSHESWYTNYKNPPFYNSYYTQNPSFLTYSSPSPGIHLQSPYP